jgi:Dolichyl-phosphate-mannose-protein mannosyltransferase
MPESTMPVRAETPDSKRTRTVAFSDGEPRTHRVLLLGIATAIALLHIATNGRYGFHRDELQFLSDARHLDWGFVAYPPVTPFLEHIGLSIFGLSLVGLRLFSVIAQAAVIVVSGLMARELGGGRLAQAIAAIAVAVSPLPIFEATEFQYSSFDLLWWVLIAYFVIRLLKTENPRWWIAIGAVVGLGLLTKYSIVFYVAGILAGVTLTRARRHFASGWFWGGIALALLIFLPNFLWLIRHDFISYHFLQHIHMRDVGEGRDEGFWKGQFLGCANLFAAPMWLAGLAVFLSNRRYRMLAWMYLVPLALFWILKGRFYYICGAYPMLLAMGAVAGERWVGGLPRWGRRTVEVVFVTGVLAMGAYFWAGWVPMASSGPLRDFALSHSEDLREEIGWDELVKTVAGIRDSLPPDQQAGVGVIVGNYGEQGAIEMLGPAYHLPPPISVTNSAWLRGYPSPPPSTLIVIGARDNEVDQIFTGCRLAGHNGNSAGVENEESEYHPDIFVCGPLRKPWPEFWKDHQSFG